MTLKLSDYIYDVVYLPGKLNTFADYLSRSPLPIEEIGTKWDDYSVTVVNDEYSAILEEEWDSEYRKDENMSVIKQLVVKGWATKDKLQDECRKHWEIKDKLSVSLAPSRSRSRSLGSFRPGSKVNQARPGTQDIHLPQGVAFHRSTRSPDVAAVQLARFTSLPPRGTPLLFSRVLVLSTPSNLNSPQQGDPGGQGLRHGPSPAPQAAQAVREGSRSSGSHSRLSRRRGAAHPASSSTTGGGGAAGAPAAGIHPRGAPQPPPGLSPPNLNSPQQEDLGGQGLRHGPSPAPRAAQAVREGSRSSGSHSLFARRCGAAHPAPSSTTGGGGPPAPPRQDPPAGRAPALTRPLAAPRQTTSSGPQSPPEIRREQLAAAAILSSSSREQPGHRMRVSRRLFINLSRQTSLQVPGTPGRHV
ncbi:hypothetical protein NDU88_003014 [Pleurodeles waltl]|uniref:Uncharacterized protein n=1 Tax=Pleurodeles waltl TaxID=8319 RepID=A0AAV7QAJ6_PLEWA|nr:hypothetical protein NDU88_003014 [Pleurodeles waltl]